MQAVQIIEQGRPLEVREVPMPEPGDGEIRVRVEAAGICHSDVHYRNGTGSVGKPPRTPGHEIAGTVDCIGPSVAGLAVGDRVALHYLVTCGRCEYCVCGLEQFCRQVRMLGKDVDGGYAEYVVVPARNAIPVAAGVTAAEAAIMMCSSATAFHALRKARAAPGDTVAVFGIGGLGMSAVQLARACGAVRVFAIDLDRAKLIAAAAYGALPIDPADGALDRQLRAATGGDGVDVVLELTGVPSVQRQAVASVGPHGRVALAGISREPFAVHSYADVINHEAEIIGVSDHLRGELVTLMQYASSGVLDLKRVIADRVPLDASAINQRLDALADFHGYTRSVIVA